MEHIAKVLIEIAAVLSALGVIGGAGHKIYKVFKGILDKLSNVEKYQREDYLGILRLTIMSEEMPLEERIAAGDKYIKLGGNGAVKHKYEQLLKQLDRGKNQ